MFRYKLIVAIMVVLCWQPLYVLAQDNEPPIPTAPTGGNVVLDNLNWLTPAQEEQINAINQKLDTEGIAQIAVVTLNDCGDDKQKFRNDLFRNWGIGHANDNDGLLILVCWYGGDQSRRSVEQETGFGLEGTLPDVLTARVVDEEFIPAFQSNHAGDGLVAMVRRYDGLLRQDIQSQPNNPGNSNNSIFNFQIAFLMIGVLGILPGLILVITFASFLTVRNGLTSNSSHEDLPSVFETDSSESKPVGIYQFALAEILSLFPILGLLYANQGNLYQVSRSVLAYSRFMFPFLTVWLILLVVFYLSKFFSATSRRSAWSSTDDNWGSSGNNQPSSGPDLLDTLSDITNDLPSFGGGDSGGGGSSKKF
jgi:uncharacterized membrane protein YgcG